MDSNTQKRIREIINTESPSFEDLKFLIEEYIFEKKGKRVEVNPVPSQDPFGAMRFQAQWHQAHWAAFEYFANKFNGEKGNE